MATVTLLGRSHDLVQHPSEAVRWEVTILATISVIRGRAAALAATIPGCEKRFGIPALTRCGYAVPVWGEAAFNALRKAGVRLDDIMAQGEIALDFLTDGLVTEADVQAAEDFSEAPAEPT